MIRLIHPVAFVVLMAGCLAADWKAANFIDSFDATRPIWIPPDFSASKFGRGKYRLDGPDSQGTVNCIFLFFEPQAAQLTIPNEWKPIGDATLQNEVIIRERVIPNPFEGEGAGDTATLRIRVTAKDAATAQELMGIAESIIRN